MNRKIAFTLILVILAYCMPLPVAAEAITASYNATPMNVSISGVDAGNKNSAEAFFNLTDLPATTVILSAKLSYVQSGTSSGQLKLINKYDFSIIDTKLLTTEGLVESNFFKDKVTDWVATPSKNLGLFIQGSDLASTAQINILGLRLDVTYEQADTKKPTIIAFTAREMTSNSVAIEWQSDEPVQAKLEYGRTSLYGSTVTSDTFSSTGESLIRELRAGSTYHFRLTLVDVAGNEISSADKSFTLSQITGNPAAANQEIVASSVLAPPRLLNGEYREVEDGRFVIDLAWEASKSPDIDGYIIFRSHGSAEQLSEYKRIDKNTTRFTDEQLEAGTSYRYFVRAYKNKLLTESSPTVTITLPDTPSGSVAGIDVSQISTSDKLALITALVALLSSLGYITFKRISNAQKQPPKAKLRNVLKDPEYYMNKFESTILENKAAAELD